MQGLSILQILHQTKNTGECSGLTKLFPGSRLGCRALLPRHAGLSPPHRYVCLSTFGALPSLTWWRELGNPILFSLSVYQTALREKSHEGHWNDCQYPGL